VPDSPRYLTPYVNAARRHGGGFESLLWASQQTQAARFGALVQLASPKGQSVLDVGCGRADFLDYCIATGVPPADYVGIEAVPALADAAEAKRLANVTIKRADFVQHPLSMFVAADVIVFSGSLNTLDPTSFYATIRRAFDATASVLAFNFLCSPGLAAAEFLHWHRVTDVLTFARSLSDDVTSLTDYLDGDATVAMRKP
jgi:SAM-dependent methyltransferase